MRPLSAAGIAQLPRRLPLAGIYRYVVYRCIYKLILIRALLTIFFFVSQLEIDALVTGNIDRVPAKMMLLGLQNTINMGRLRAPLPPFTIARLPGIKKIKIKNKKNPKLTCCAGAKVQILTLTRGWQEARRIRCTCGGTRTWVRSLLAVLVQKYKY